MTKNKVTPVVLCILDGWGKSSLDSGNAISMGNTPVFDQIDIGFPPIFIDASAEHVGLPGGQMGNSEVGHLNIGAGRVVLQDLPKVNSAIEDGSFYKNEVITAGMREAKGNGGKYHLVGLLSDGGVHSHIDHIKAFLETAKRESLTEVYIHPLTDGRDTPPESGAGYLKQLQNIIKEVGIGKIATVAGRYWTMDRDNRWDRVEKGFNALVHGQAVEQNSDALKVLEASYKAGVTDEFIEPTVITDGGGKPLSVMSDGDVVQFFNFRSDRVRQITSALYSDSFDKFNRGSMPKLSVYCMTEYSAQFNLPVAFNSSAPRNGIGEYLSNLGIAQFRTAETEKYAHVTYFFNGGMEEAFDGEERKLASSPKVATYDLQPEMSAGEVADNVVGAINSGRFGLVVVNFANGDMVGHTGVFEAALKAVKTVDACVGRLKEAVDDKGGWMIITADHGNIENMKSEEGKVVTSHSTNLVPFYVIGEKKVKLSENGGALCDVAPTVLYLMGLDKPEEMTGSSLVVSK